MKTWVMLIIALMLSSWPINMAQADDSSMNSEANVTIRQGSFDYNESSPYAMPGVAGTFIQSYTEIRDDAKGFTPIYLARFDQITEAELRGRVKGGIVENHYAYPPVIEENGYPLTILKADPTDLRYVGYSYAVGKANEFEDSVVERALFSARVESRAHNFAIQIDYRKEPFMWGVSVGGGSAKELSEDSSGTVGSILGFSTAKNDKYVHVVVLAYGGKKTIPVPEVKKVEPAKERIEKTPAPQTEQNDTAENIVFDAPPIFFDFNIDHPRSGQEETFTEWAKFIGSKFGYLTKTGKTIQFLGSADKVGPESYNSDLAMRRAKSVMYIVIEKLIFGKTKEEQENILAACRRIFRATSASNFEPDFDRDDLNRRTDLLIVDKNLTKENIGFNSLKKEK